MNLLLEPVAVEKMDLGDVILIRVNNWPQHLAIITQLKPNITIIHSYPQAYQVVEQHLSREWQDNIVAVYKTVQIYCY